MKRILIIEDDREIAELERDYLESSGFDCSIEARGKLGLERAVSEDFALIIIDIMLPGMNGFDVLLQIRRKKQTPVIFLSAKDTDFDKIQGLGLGANDYMTKPFSPAELVARVKAHIARHDAITQSTAELVGSGSLLIDKTAHKVMLGENEVFLTAKEYDLLLFLAENPNRTFSKEALLDKVWGYDYFGDRSTVAVHIQHIREKIDTASEKHIETVWGVGYRFA